MMLRNWMLSGLLALPLAAAAAPPDPRVAAELESTLVRLYEIGALDSDDAQPLVFEREPHTRYELGAVVDAATPGSGLPVVAVTPGGNADRLGVKVGDRLLRMNSVALAGATDPVSAFQQAVAASGGSFDLLVSRAGRDLALAGEAQATEVPGYRLAVVAPRRACGRVSVFDAAPRGRQLYPAVLVGIDDEAIGESGTTVFRLAPGRHTLTVAEAIDADRFGAAQQAVRDRRSRERYKRLDIEVEADTTYLLAAQLHLDRRGDIRSGGYWDPVIWSTRKESCR